MFEQMYFMRKLIVSSILLLIVHSLNAQQMGKPSIQEISNLPEWAQKIYEENINVFEVDQCLGNHVFGHRTGRSL